MVNVKQYKFSYCLTFYISTVRQDLMHLMCILFIPHNSNFSEI